MRTWLVRLGKYGEMEARALEKGELVTGWQLGSLDGAATKDAILPIVAAASPDQKPGTLTNWAVQLNQFLNTISVGDMVVVPMKTTGQLAIGNVVGNWFQTSEGNPARKVEWLRSDLPRQAIKQDLLYSLGATQTVCEISRNEATKRFLAAAKNGADPGPVLAGAAKTISDASVEAADSPLDLAPAARDEIESYISSHFTGHAFTRLIAEILRAQGYQVQVSPPGADKGVDIMAGQGALGFDGPRLVVQVKSGDIVTDQPTLQGLIGCVADTHAEHGLLVSWSGFKSSVRQRVNELYFRVRLWDRQDILTALFTVYERLPDEVRAELPLRRIWTLVPDAPE